MNRSSSLPMLLPGVLVALALAACSCSTGPSLPGNWAPESAELGGKIFPVAAFEGATLRLTADAYDFGGDKGTYTLLSTNPPAGMDIHGQVGPNAGRTIKAIYAVSGDQLTVCYQLGPGERPAEFNSAAGPQVLLVRYRRVP